MDKFHTTVKSDLEKKREEFLLYVMRRCNKENRHYNQYFSAGDMGILYLYVGHHGNWESQWTAWDDMNTGFLVDYLKDRE